MTFTKDNPPPFTQPSSTTFGYSPQWREGIERREMVGENGQNNVYEMLVKENG